MHKITFVTRNLLSGGAERVITQLANYFVNNGWLCQVITMYADDIFYQLDSKIEIIQIDEKNLVNGTIKDKFIRYKKLRSIIKQSKTDIVLAMPEDIGIYVIAAMIGTGIPVVVSERNNPWVMPYNRISRVLRRILYPITDGLIFQTEGAAKFFSQRIRRKSIILPNPLDLNRLPNPYDGKREKCIVSVGRLEEQKNFRLLINAFDKVWQSHQDYKLIIYGEGTKRAELESLANSNKSAKNISLPGRDKNVLERINKSSLFVMTSDYEGVPNALIEAMAIGLPCISTDCEPGGARALIEDGVNGLLVPVNDEESLVNAICKILDNNIEVGDICKNAIRIRDILDCNVVCKQWETYLLAILNRR